AHGNRDRAARVARRYPADDAIGRRHRDRAHLVAPDMLLNLGHQVDRRPAVLALRPDLEGVVDLRQLPGVELDVDHRTDHLDDPSDVLCHYTYLLFQSRGAAHDLRDLLSDLGLARTVVGP